jgi:hypothetical protein
LLQGYDTLPNSSSFYKRPLFHQAQSGVILMDWPISLLQTQRAASIYSKAMSGSEQLRKYEQLPGMMW